MSGALAGPDSANLALTHRFVDAIRDEIRRDPPTDRLVFMHVCGTHEHEIERFGLRGLLPPEIRLLAGPGCPVCVTPASATLHAIAIAREAGAVLTTYGDMVRVPVGETSLAGERARGLELAIVLGPSEALAMARGRRGRPVVFFSPGFETTAAPLAALLAADVPDNFFVYSAHRRIAPALSALLSSHRVAVAGLLLPGHVLTITGFRDFEFLAHEFGVAAVVSGFEAVDILAAVLALVRTRRAPPKVINLYPRSVRRDGNPRARRLLASELRVVDAEWRGIGSLRGSGLAVAAHHAAHDAAAAFRTAMPSAPRSQAGCLCGAVLLGAVEPRDCPLFGASCTPEWPVGPCMVSEEGACRAAWTWRGLEDRSS